jgi:2'-5' RNA ligase
MAFIGFRVPAETAQLFKSIDVPGDRENFHHITILNFGDTMSIEDIGLGLEVAYDVISEMQPFKVKTNKITCFPGGDDGVPIICPVESEELHELWEKLGEAFDEAGISFSKKFPVYKPHVTLSFAPEPIDDRSIPTIEWGAHELVLWGGDGGDRGIAVHIPFSLRAAGLLRVVDLRKNIPAHRVAARYREGRP